MALPNGDLITTVFDPQMAYPVDKRMQVDTLNSRDSMSMFIRWEGMEVYVLENKTKYILQGGRSNEFWKESGNGAGTGGTTFVGQFESADLLPTSGRSAGDYAFVGTGDDFVQYNWDNIAGQWVMAEGQTDMASEFFHIGYKTPLRRPVIFPLFPKDILVETSGDFVFAPETSVARFIFVGEVEAIRGIETAAADRESKYVNRTGSDIVLRDKASGIPSGSGMDFGGTDYTWVNGSEITMKGNGTYWELAPNNQIAFSDHLDSVNAQVSVGGDGLETIHGVLLEGTSEQVSYKERSTWFDGTPMTNARLDGVMFNKLNDKFFFASDAYNQAINIERYRMPGDSDHDVIQKAFNFISSSKSGYSQFYLRIPSGRRYFIDHPLILNTTSDVFLIGDGLRKSSINASAAMDAMVVLGTGQTSPFVGRCMIKGLTFNGGNLASSLLDARGTRYSFFSENEFVNVAENGEALRLDGWVQTVERNTFSNQSNTTGLTGIRVYSSLVGNRVSIENNSVTGYNIGCKIDGVAPSINISKNTFDNCQGVGVYFSGGARGMTIYDNYFERCGQTGVTIRKGGEGSGEEIWKSAIIGTHNYSSTTSWINGLSIENNQFANCSDTDNGLITLSGLLYATVKDNYTYLGYYNKYFVDLRWEGTHYTSVRSVVIEHSPTMSDQFEQLVGLNADNIINHNSLVIRDRKTASYFNNNAVPNWHDPFLWGDGPIWNNFNEHDIPYNGNKVWNYRGDSANSARQLNIDLTQNVNIRGKYFRVNWFHQSDSATLCTFTAIVDGVNVAVTTSNSSGSWSQGGRGLVFYVPVAGNELVLRFQANSASLPRKISGFSITPASYDLGHEITAKPTKSTNDTYVVGGSPDGFQKAMAGRISLDLYNGKIYQKTTPFNTITGWVEIDQQNLPVKSTQTQVDNGTNDTTWVTPLVLANSSRIVSSVGAGLTGTDGGQLTGTIKSGAIVRNSVSTVQISYPTQYADVTTINGPNFERTYSILKERDSTRLFIQRYNSTGLGQGWVEIGGATTFNQLTDTPASKTGNKNKTVKVSNDETTHVYVADGVDVRNETSGGSISLALTDGFISSRLNFTSATAVTLQGLSSANGQSSLTLVNPHATNNLTIKHNGAGTVKYISPTATDFVIPPKTAARFEIVGNEIYPVISS